MRLRPLGAFLVASFVSAALASCSATGGQGGASAIGGGGADDPAVVLRAPIDPAEQTSVEFGQRSHWAQPWRAYLDTVPGTRFRDAVGVNFNVDPEEAAATARLLASAGVRRARVEIGWGSFRYDDPARLVDPARYRTVLRALEANGIRPLILLNAHENLPCPTLTFDALLAASAHAGDRTVQLEPATAALVVPGRTGLSGLGDSKAAGILFVSVAADGRAALSKPLPTDLAAGPHPAATLAYAPFQRPTLSGGGPNPRFAETLAGWLAYTEAVTRFTRRILGSTEFDVEVWNELTFGSSFLDSDTYYDPAVDTASGDTPDVILRRTVAFLREPARGLRQMGIGNGFANQRPWDAGSTSPPGLTAIDKHPYGSPRRFPEDAVYNGVTPLDALGRPDVAIQEPEHIVDRFVPAYTSFFPEYFLTAIQTEHFIRDVSPITTKVYDTPHGRRTHPPGGAPPGVWVTEWNLDPGEGGLGASAGPLGAAQRFVQAKAVLRALVAFVAKGVDAVYVFAAKDERLGVIQPGFFRAAAAGRYPGDGAGGLTMNAVRRLTAPFRGARRLERVQPLRVLSIGDYEGRAQFEGDGTDAHPPLYDRDVTAVFPFQLDARRFLLAAYVMTRDVTATTRPARYRLTVGGIRSCALRLRGADPLSGKPVPIRKVSCGRSLVIEAPLTDSPRLIEIAVTREGA